MNERQTLIRTYLIADLERWQKSGKSYFTQEEIQIELERRRDLEWKKCDPRYPELNHS